MSDKGEGIRVIEINQIYSTRVQNVTPYAMNYFPGTMELFPSSDVWVDQVRNAANVFLVDREEQELQDILNSDPQSGYAGSTWDAVTKTWLIPEIL